MKLKSAISFLLFGLLGYFGYGLVRVHTSGDVIAYKHFTSLLRKDDFLSARKLVAEEKVMKVFQTQEKRQPRYQGDVKFTWHQVLQQQYSATGDEVTLRVRQITRLDPPGTEQTLFGSRAVEEIHEVALRRDKQVWKVVRYTDPYFRG